MRPVYHLTTTLVGNCVLVAVLAFVGCGSKGSPTVPQNNTPPATNNPPPVTLASVNVASARNAIIVGESEQFSATASFSDSSTQNVSSTATWSSTNTGVATVSGSGLVTAVAAGSADIRATFQGATGTRTLQVNAPAATSPVARFTVSGPGGSNVCRIIKGSGGDIDCRFDGSTSTGGSGGNINRWRWRFDVGANSFGPVDRNDPVLDPNPGCGFFVDKPAAQAGTAFVQMIVKLEVRNAAGTSSTEARNANVRLFPQNECGFGF